MRRFDRIEISRILNGRPEAIAAVRGGAAYPEIKGEVRFYQTSLGALIVAVIEGLPGEESGCGGKMLGFHIHNGRGCAEGGTEPFSETGTHYNPGDCLHPFHAGDLPPLLETDGRAFMAVISGNFRVAEILFRTVVIHRDADDLHTQPAGASGEKIACGMILPAGRW